MNLDRIGTIVRLELTQRVRSVAWYVLLGVFAVLLLLVTVLSFLAFSSQETRGGSVYAVVVYFVLLLVVLVSPTLSGNAINGDRDAATLAPVQVTLATTGEIVLGKFLAAWVTGLAFLAVAVPFIVASTVAGGVSIATMAISLLVLIVETAIVAAIGVALSGILARPLFSVASTYLVVAALCVGTLIAFGLSGAVVRSEATSSYRSIEFDSQGNPVEPQTCGPWQTDTYEMPRYDYVWWMLTPNPFVILADATPATFDRSGYPVDLFSQIKTGMRLAQLPPDLEYVWDDCDRVTQQSSQPAPRELLDSTVPSWFVGLALQLVLAAGLLWWAWARTRTPARRLPPGTRIA
ncbi:ABC transporter permease [Microbacterium sp. P5_E9]